MPQAQFVQGCLTWNALNNKDLLKVVLSPLATLSTEPVLTAMF